MEIVRVIESLSVIPGVSGWEDNVRAEIMSIIEGYCETEIDALGNLIAYKKGAGRAARTVQFSAHMDEVGFIITMIEDSGLLRFAAVGGIDSRVAAGRTVEIGGRRIPGVIGAKAVHMLESGEADKPAPIEKLVIDIGARDKAQAEAAVTPGDRAVFRSEFQRFGSGGIMGRALDDRAGCALMIDMIRSELPFDCVFTFTVQEETGCTGAVAAGYRVRPDISIAIETTTASDIAGVPADKKVCKLGGGPVISFMDRGTVYDHALYTRALELAKEHDIPCQPKRGVAGGNESRSLQTARAGSRAMAVSLPCRYLHTASNVLSVPDITATRRLLELLLAEAARP